MDFGGCRCRAKVLTDPRNADPVCVFSPSTDRVDLTVAAHSDDFVMRALPQRQPDLDITLLQPR